MKILFQGDSVTDAGRDRSDPHDLGGGYPKFASGMIEDAFPDVEFEFYNRGVSGDRSEQLLKRLQEDLIDLQPDIVSIMIGVNDVWHYFSHGIVTTDEDFENNYRAILTAIRERTNAKILMIEPFILYAEDKIHMHTALDAKIRVVRKLAREFADAYVPMDGLFASECVKYPQGDYTFDGVHPKEDGARFIGESYLKGVTPLIESLVSEK